MRNPEYIGDGVYIYYNGYSFELRANHHKYPTDRIVLEPEVLKKMNSHIEGTMKYIEILKELSPEEREKWKKDFLSEEQ